MTSSRFMGTGCATTCPFLGVAPNVRRPFKELSLWLLSPAKARFDGCADLSIQLPANSTHAIDWNALRNGLWTPWNSARHLARAAALTQAAIPT